MELNEISRLRPSKRPPLALSSDPHPEKPVGPIELEMKKTLSRLQGSSYTDTFDWSVYDKIASRLEEPPRGGVVFNTTFKLVNHHSSCSRCHYAFELDTYGRGCTHNCVYCYAKDQLNSHGFWNRPYPFPVNLAEIRKVFYTVFETNKPSKWREILEKRIPIRLGSMSDCFMWLDKKYGVTKELLKILSHYDYPYIVFTRSDLVATDEYLNLLRPDLASIQFSICGGNEKLTSLIEPGAVSVARRLIALRKLRAAGIWTTVRINPLFPIFPDGYFSDPASLSDRFSSREAVPKFDLFDFGFVDQLADSSVSSVLAGFVRLSNWSINNISKASGVDLKQFFKPDVLAKNGDKHFSDAEISYYYREIHKKCLKHNMRFNTCYIGNGVKDYYQYQNLWSNKKDCCDAVGKVDAFKRTSQEISWNVRAKHAPCKADVLKSEKMDLDTEQQFSQRTKKLWIQPKSLDLDL